MKRTTLSLLITAAIAAAITPIHSQDDPEPPEPPVGPEFQPDLVVGAKGKAPVGNDVYGSANEQTLALRSKGRQRTSFSVGVQNDGTEDDTIRLQGSKGSRKFRLSYFNGDRNITGRVVRGAALDIAAGEAVRISAVATPSRKTVKKGARDGFRFTAGSRAGQARDGAAVVIGQKKKKKRSNNNNIFG